MNLDINKIIDRENIKMFFQPIVSLKKKSIIGVEALLRGIDNNNNVIPPNKLFKEAKKKNLQEKLDILAKKIAIKDFHAGKLELDNFLLFLNVDVSNIKNNSKSNIDSTMKEILKWSNKLNLKPQNIVIEILESQTTSMKALKKLTCMYKQRGFLIALDDVGSGYSNLRRISCLKPDIIKVDRSLISEIDENHFRQDAFKSLVLLGEKIGAMVLAEGVETQGEAFKAMELGADLLQGYFIGFPYTLTHKQLGHLEDKLLSLHSSYKGYLKNILEYKKENIKSYQDIATFISSSLRNSHLNRFNNILKGYVHEDSLIECAYVLNDNGFQVGETVISDKTFSPKKKNFMFHPAKAGEDHSLKEYFYQIDSKDLNSYITDPYISLASGNRCITISKKITDLNNNDYVFCLDINVNNEIKEFKKINTDYKTLKCFNY